MSDALPIDTIQVNAFSKIMKSTLFPDFEVKILARESNCDPQITAKSTLDLLSNHNPAVIIGAACEEPTLTITPLANSYNIPVISWNSDSADLADKNTYPLFMRNMWSRRVDAEWFINVCLHFNWKFVNFISDGLNPFANAFYTMAIAQNITVVNNIITSKSDASAFKSQLQLIKDSGASVILVNVDNNIHYNAADILLQNAIDMNMFATEFIWVMDNLENYLLDPVTNLPRANFDGVLSQNEYNPFHIRDLGQKIIDM